MSKKDLKNYLSELDKSQLEIQFLDLYDKFKDVKVYYDFVFRPNEKNLIKDAKLKISNEYFPINNKRPKMRRSVAQKFINHFINLGMDQFLIADLMLYNIEIAQSLSLEKKITTESFYKSMIVSFEQAAKFVVEKSIFYEFKNRFKIICQETKTQNWPNFDKFESVIDKIDF